MRASRFWLALLLAGSTSKAGFGQTSSEVHPATALGRNLRDSFTGTSLFWHSAAIVATGALVESGADAETQGYFARRRELDPYTVPAVWLGYFMPLVLGGGLALHGVAARNRDTRAAGSAVLQATLIAVATTSVLKAVTGRPNPDPTREPDMLRASREFRFGFLRGGIHYGWPSGHLGVNTAAMTSLAAYYDSWAVTLAATSYLGYLAFGVTAHEGSTMHWLSDVVAGTLMGFAIGTAVGRGFRRTVDERTAQSPRVTLAPLAGAGCTGFVLSGAF
jgi:membrane-associated phospholipid phosphatase